MIVMVVGMRRKRRRLLERCIVISTCRSLPRTGRSSSSTLLQTATSNGGGTTERNGVVGTDAMAGRWVGARMGMVVVLLVVVLLVVVVGSSVTVELVRVGRSYDGRAGLVLLVLDAAETTRVAK